MDSSNNGRSRIAPLEIETLETISCDLKIGNQIVPFSKTEPPFRKVEFVSQSNTSDNTTHLGTGILQSYVMII